LLCIDIGYQTVYQISQYFLSSKISITRDRERERKRERDYVIIKLRKKMGNTKKLIFAKECLSQSKKISNDKNIIRTLMRKGRQTIILIIILKIIYRNHTFNFRIKSNWTLLKITVNISEIGIIVFGFN